MNFNDFITTLGQRNLVVFSFDDLSLLYTKETRGNLRKLMYRWKQKGWISPLKKGLYELAYPKRLNIPDLFIANKLYQPSYVSLETALSYHGIIPEVAMAVTSLTTKPTRQYRNEHGLFLYRTIRPKAFNGYYVEKVRGYDVLIAEPEKAFIDYLYFAVGRGRKIRLADQRFEQNRIAGFKRGKLKAYSQAYNLDIKEVYAHL